MNFEPILKVAQNVTGGPSWFDGERQYFATADVEGATLLQGVSVTFDNRPSRANLVSKPGDVLFAKMQATEKVLHINGEARDAIFSTGFFNLRSRKGMVHPRYLFWSIMSAHFQAEKNRLCTGATQKALTLSALANILIPLPNTIREQEIIAENLDKADSIRIKRQQSLALADDFIRSVFLEKFGDPIVNAKGLPKQPLGKFGKIVTGNTPPRSDPGNFGDAVEWIKSDNVNTEEHFLTRAAEGLSVKGKALGRIVPKGSILVTCIAGSPASIGRAAIADRSVACNQQINAITPYKDVNIYFLYAQFLIGKTLVLRSSTNSMKGMISKGEFQKIEFLRPEPSEQEKFGKVFEKQIKASRLLREASIQAAELFNTLSQRAFRGEL
jgi:type I restriction enzyme S subunit